MKDPLLSLLRLRSTALDDAKRIVAEALDAQAEALRHAQTAEARVDDEARAASDLAGEDAAVEAFARWLPLGRAEMERCRDAERAAASGVDRARAALSLARAAHKSVETLIARRAEADALKLARKEQAQLDDLGTRRGEW